MSFPDITLKRGDSLYPNALIAWVDTEKTERVDLAGASAEAVVRSKQDSSLIVDLEPTIEPAADYWPTVADDQGQPLGGDCIVFELEANQTDSLAIGTHKWELKVVFPTLDEQTIVEGDFKISNTLNP